ncbi:hypothetical protein SAMN05421780_101412 [Flexibacter flexilis DSM 6793]|uniref:Uncharacterized protein n=1 Tax=Flexibacter flexilis DSM 6793 TaxID=927664 RepID=A0A1I1DQQ4_9BACT|nr:hypothetical protein [Flexibacter flexilis]SFB77339.1 hypothetical protein SAMN05421780_101412 [Flexibacter flexilis DSM 6793]
MGDCLCVYENNPNEAMTTREANVHGIVQIQTVRNAVHENTLSAPRLITDADVAHFLA